MGKSRILMRKVNQVKADQYETILRINAPNGGLSGQLETVAITHVLKKDAEMRIQIDGGEVGGGLLCSSINEYDSADLSLGSSFEEEIVITGKNVDSVPGSFSQFWVIYSVDAGTPIPARKEIKERHGVDYETRWFETQTGDEYSIQVPQPLKIVTQTILEEDTTFKGEDEGRVSGNVFGYLRGWLIEDGGSETFAEAEAPDQVDVYQFDDQDYNRELEGFVLDEKPELSITLPGSSRQIIEIENVFVDDITEISDKEHSHPGVFPFEFTISDSKIPEYEGPIEIKATYSDAENLPGIVHVV